MELPIDIDLTLQDFAGPNQPLGEATDFPLTLGIGLEDEPHPFPYGSAWSNVAAVREARRTTRRIAGLLAFRRSIEVDLALQTDSDSAWENLAKLSVAMTGREPESGPYTLVAAHYSVDALELSEDLRWYFRAQTSPVRQCAYLLTVQPHPWRSDITPALLHTMLDVAGLDKGLPRVIWLEEGAFTIARQISCAEHSLFAFWALQWRLASLVSGDWHRVSMGTGDADTAALIATPLF